MVGTRRSASQAATPDTPTPATRSTVATRRSTRNNKNNTATTAHRWSHAPTTLTLAWLAISLPLVTWDTGYVLGRPATMPGGWAHAPLWTPYELYGRVDHMYGFKQWNLGNGFTAAQGVLNVVETVMYLVYWGIWYRAAGAAVVESEEGGRKRIAGRAGALAVVVGLSASVMTVSKTVLYWLNEYFSGFDNIGHNTPWDLVLLWIIPNGLWLVVPSYIIYQLGSEIIDAITIASYATGSIKTE
ncbi:hypothetical protein N0V82_005330 [Gnomoniopsis sp. IMI 355080]|nr:hypothetical protein N0V82_005330 [Gnomoniopsis sp. IMI 355080]